MAKVTAQQTNALITFYLKEHSEKYGKPPEINRYREKWGFQAMIEDLGMEGAKEIIKYYYATSRVGHPLTYLLRNYDKLNRIRRDLLEDSANREKLRRETELRVREWEKNVNN